MNDMSGGTDKVSEETRRPNRSEDDSNSSGVAGIHVGAHFTDLCYDDSLLVLWNGGKLSLH